MRFRGRHGRKVQQRMNPVARMLIFAGIVLLVLGVLWQLGSRYLPLGRLPGDIAIERGNVRFYFPLATCIVLSLLLSLLLWLWRRWGP